MSFEHIASQRKHILKTRAQILRLIRDFFYKSGFVEVETPLLVRYPTLDVNIHPVAAGKDNWLITSPEFQMKQLLCEGFDQIYTICKCFRYGETGDQHNSEFTMLEWYRAHVDVDVIMHDVKNLIGFCAKNLPQISVETDVSWNTITVEALTKKYVGIAIDGSESQSLLRDKLASVGLSADDNLQWSDLFYTAWVERIDPILAKETKDPLFVVDWPIELASLARRKADNPYLVERFELYWGGFEIANAFGELSDAVEQRERFEQDQRLRQEKGLPVYEMDEAFLNALNKGMPPAGGIALGVDRLVMLFTGSHTISDVLTFSDSKH